jgi:Protein of unknown function (DUF3352)
MHRLVIALTTFLALVAAVVVAGYLFVFAVSPDRTARAAPADSVAYATVYLQLSAGQGMNLAELLGRVPGFADAAALEQKIHEIAQRLLGDAGLDYEGDLRPWLGDQLAVAVAGDELDDAQPGVVALIDVRDAELARDALERIVADSGVAYTTEDHEGVEVRIAEESAYALTTDLLIVGEQAASVRAALDADAGRAPSLDEDAGFRTAMQRLPADHLGSAYLDLAGLGAATDAEEQLDGYQALSMALLVERDGLRVVGSAPFDEAVASDAAREAFALATEPSSLADWMPQDTQAEAVVFGLSQTLLELEEQVATTPGLEGAADVLVQMRAIAALVGINLDDDVLPLFDREVAIAVSDLDADLPAFTLLLRPNDAAEATAALQRVRDALTDLGAGIDERDEAGTLITTLAIPDVPAISYAMGDGVVILALSTDDVAGALRAHADGATLSASDRYQAAWELAGDRGGNEVYLDVASLVDRLGAVIDLPDDGRDILQEVGALAITAPARDDAIIFHLVVTVR